MRTCLWKEPLQVSEMVAFADFYRKYHILLNMKAEEWDLEILFSNYRKYLALVLEEIYFLEVGAYVSLKGATRGVSEGHLAEFDWKYHIFWKINSEKWDRKVLFYNYWNNLVLGLVETCFSQAVHTCLWKEPLQLSEKVSLLNLTGNITFFKI